MMQLKHQWNEEQAKIITEAKIQMARKTFETDLDMISVIQIVLNRRDVPFYEVWRDISSDLNRDSWRDVPFWYSVLLQAGTSVLLMNKANIQQLLRTFPQLKAARLPPALLFLRGHTTIAKRWGFICEKYPPFLFITH